MIDGGKSFISSPPAFSSDAKKLLVCTGNTVSVFSTSTGMLTLELEGHTDLVTSVIVVPATAAASEVLSNCWTSSLDGTIRYWDFSVPELIKKVEVKYPICSMVIPRLSSLSIERNETLPNHFAFISVENINKQNHGNKTLQGQIRIVDLSKSHVCGGPLAETRKPEVLTVSYTGDFFGIQNKRKLHVWQVPAKDYKYDEVKKIKLHHTKTFTCLAFHPTERVIAGGDHSGRILLWRGFGNKTFLRRENGAKMDIDDDRPGVRGDDDADSCSTWHWHPTEVNFLSFSSDGAYLYSGGKEGVLVVWQLDTGKKKFLPRIGSPLLYFTASPDPTLSCVSCADNQIHLLKMPRMDIVKSIAGIKPPRTLPDSYKGLSQGFIFNHAAGLAAVPTETYCIQLYSLFDDQEFSQIQICERHNQPVDDVSVILTLASISVDGSKMGTVDVKLPEDTIGGLVTLKFWELAAQNREFTLSTVIYGPHSEAEISALAFHPTQDMAVSSSFGGDFKIWAHSNDTQHGGESLKQSGWRCQSVGSYKKRPMTAAAFSTDGSVLAVAAEVVITLWDPQTNALLAVMGETLMPNVKLSFIGKSDFLVSISRGSSPQLSVWNMSKLSISWSYKLLAEDVSCDMDNSHFAVLALSTKPSESGGIALHDRDGVILIFSEDNPVPLSTWSVKKAKGGGLGFIRPNLSSPDEIDGAGDALSKMLVYMNGDHEYVIFNPYNNDKTEMRRRPRGRNIQVEDTPGQYGYASIYGELLEIDAKSDQIPTIPFVPSDRPWETIFSGSSHVLPPLSQLCSVFLASLLEKRPSIEQQ